MERIRAVIDLHCDTLSECLKRDLELKNDCLHFSLDKLPQGYKLCQAMAVFMPDELRGEEAIAYFDAVHGIFVSQMERYGGEISQVWDFSQIERALEQKRFAAIFTVEGGSALGGKLENVERLYRLGVRMMTLTWNAENEICGGVGTELGFTDFGRKVVADMERLGMAVDVSHLSDNSFWELCGFAKRPFLASHSNSRSICKRPRNLTDDMFKEIMRRGGVVGHNYYKGFIRDDGENGTVDDLLRHVHHFLDLGGEDTIALGSDFDGADMPDYLGKGIGSIDYIAESLEKSGISALVTDKILFGNANRFFMKLAGETKV